MLQRRHLLRPTQRLQMLLSARLHRTAVRSGDQRLLVVALRYRTMRDAAALRLQVRVPAESHRRSMRAAHQRMQLESVQQRRPMRRA